MIKWISRYISFDGFKWSTTNDQSTSDSTEFHLVNWCEIFNWSSISICTFYDGIGGFSTFWIISTNSNAIRILQFFRKLPGFSVQSFQFFVGKVSIYLSRMFVFIVLVKLVLQQIVLIFMCPQKVPFFGSCLIEFLFHINNWVFNSFNGFFAYCYISHLWCSL